MAADQATQQDTQDDEHRRPLPYPHDEDGNPTEERADTPDAEPAKDQRSSTDENDDADDDDTNADDTGADDTSADSDSGGDDDADSGDDESGDDESGEPIYNDRDQLDFDPDEGFFTGTAVDGGTDIPGEHILVDDVPEETADEGGDDSDDSDSDSDSDQSDGDKRDGDERDESSDGKHD